MDKDRNPAPGTFHNTLFDALKEGLFFVDSERRIIYWNPAMEKLTGYRAAETEGNFCWKDLISCVDFNGTDLCPMERCPLLRKHEGLEYVEEEVFLRHKEGHRISVVLRSSESSVTGFGLVHIAEINDNTAKVFAFNKIKKLEQLAFIDELTEVGNRRYCEIKINAKLAEMGRYEWQAPFGLLFIDVDYFKDFNDRFGHETGDKVLKLVARTIRSNIRDIDFVGRWGGEEFIVVISNCDERMAYETGDRLRALVENSALVELNKKLGVTVSIGVTVAKREDDMRSVVNRADRVMYRCKEMGRNHCMLGR